MLFKKKIWCQKIKVRMLMEKNEKLRKLYEENLYRKKRGFLILNKEHLLKLMKKYKTDPKIAKVLGCSKQNIELYRKKWGVAHSKKPPSIKDHIIEAITKKPNIITSAYLSKKLKCNRCYVCYIARIYKLPLKKGKSTGAPSKIKQYHNKKNLKKLQDIYGVDKNIAKFLKVTTPYVCYLRNKYKVKPLHRKRW